MTRLKSPPAPITGPELEMFRIERGLNVGEMCFLIGVSRPRWAHLTRSGIVDDPALGMAIRLWRKFPELCPIQRPIPISKVVAYIKKSVKDSSGGANEISDREVAISFGREPTATYRWNDPGQATTTSVARLGDILMRLPNPARTMHEVVLEEAKSRGVDPFRDGTWRKAGRKSQKKSEK